MLVLVFNLYADGQSTSPEENDQITIVTIAALVPVVVLFVFGFFFYYRLKRESYFRERELELKYAKSEMEIRALRAQVNPHFIFNCLSSIQHAIHHKDTEHAEKYLVKFSRLIRQVLEHSSNQFISLAEDLEILELYVDLEILRLNGLFSYEVKFLREIDANQVYVPPLLLQPLIENAIWHGLSNRSQPDGQLQLCFDLEEDALIAYIIDNGIKNASQSNHSGKSHGLRLVEERIKLLTRTEKDSYLELKKLIDQNTYKGMQVRVEVPTEQN